MILTTLLSDLWNQTKISAVYRWAVFRKPVVRHSIGSQKITSRRKLQRFDWVACRLSLVLTEICLELYSLLRFLSPHYYAILNKSRTARARHEGHLIRTETFLWPTLCHLSCYYSLEQIQFYYPWDEQRDYGSEPEHLTLPTTQKIAIIISCISAFSDNWLVPRYWRLSHRLEEFRHLGLEGCLDSYWPHEVTWFYGHHTEANGSLNACRLVLGLVVAAGYTVGSHHQPYVDARSRLVLCLVTLVTTSLHV